MFFTRMLVALSQKKYIYINKNSPQLKWFLPSETLSTYWIFIFRFWMHTTNRIFMWHTIRNKQTRWRHFQHRNIKIACLLLKMLRWQYLILFILVRYNFFFWSQQPLKCIGQLDGKIHWNSFFATDFPLF